MSRNFSTQNLLRTLIILVLVFAVIALVTGMTKVEDVEGGIAVKGLYAVFLPFESIVSTALLDAQPAGLMRISGIGMGFIQLGNYRASELGAVKVIILKREPPYLLVETAQEKVLFGLGAEKNTELYEKFAAKARNR